MSAVEMLEEIWAGLGGDSTGLGHVNLEGAGSLPAVFAVSDLAAASIGAAGAAVAELIEIRHGQPPNVQVDRRLGSMWFGTSVRPRGWDTPPVWDPTAGDYRGTDGWIRLHTNAAHHRAAALAVLDVPAEKERVAEAVGRWRVRDLETAIVANGGCAAEMRSATEWLAHPQGRSVSKEPLLHLEPTDTGATPEWPIPAERPLLGIRVLDLTRILAGPVATRLLAGFGADVLRLDPPLWDEPALVAEVTLGKRPARLDLRDPAGRRRFEHLLADADVLVHGYRSDALERLGLGAERRGQIRPGLIDVSLDAYGWTGPWKGRRGYDSLVQMSSGIAEAGMRRLGRDIPTPLPVQALDHATGYLLAAAVIRGISRRLTDREGSEARASLARTAELLVGYPSDDEEATLAPEQPGDQLQAVEQTSWGPAGRLRPPLTVEGAPMAWQLPARALGTSPPAW